MISVHEYDMLKLFPAEAFFVNQILKRDVSASLEIQDLYGQAR